MFFIGADKVISLGISGNIVSVPKVIVRYYTQSIRKGKKNHYIQVTIRRKISDENTMRN